MIDQKLETIFRIVLDIDKETDVTKIRQLDSEQWDSLAHVSIIAAIESEFGITLDSADHEQISSYAAARLLLAGRDI